MRRAVQGRPIEIAGPAGVLEGLVEAPDREVSTVAVVCHPHPLHGGTMDNKVVHTLARAFHRAGAAAVRFNFRGVGRSAGHYDDGRGEVEDAAAAAAWAASEYPGSALFLAGFSFGAAVALRAAPRLRPVGLVTVAPPVARIPADFEVPACPWLIVHGEQDEIVPLEDVRKWLAALDEAPPLVVIDGATHFFHRSLTALAEHATAFYDRSIGADGAREPHRGADAC